ncbi:MAG TPA: cytochrome ubiquinol oxidase subunit I, partial [Actinotalea sp.]|nr:cytochrome ubiquinol oxidase subunit I [Actinotalea sp.]
VSKAWFGRLGLLALPMPFIAAEFGWIFTEMGRQPWIVAPNPNPSGVDGVWMLTASAVSSVVSPMSVIISLVAFTLIYLVCAVLWFMLLKRYTVKGVEDVEPDVSPDAQADSGTDRPMSFAY